ncbi:MAG: hypothetical protein HGA54_03215 [Actinobacteria bacterium]|nr:hypothetical protein [Actinomycetota bacterium]
MAAGYDFTFAASACGVLFGLIGFAPLYIASRVITPAIKSGAMALGLVSVGLSLVLMIGAVLVCSVIAPGALLSFGVFTALAFLVATGIFTYKVSKHIGE